MVKGRNASANERVEFIYGQRQKRECKRACRIYLWSKAETRVQTSVSNSEAKAHSLAVVFLPLKFFNSNKKENLTIWQAD